MSGRGGSPLRVVIYRLDSTIDFIEVPVDCLSRLYLFCSQADLTAFEYDDEGEKVVVWEDVHFKRFATLLAKEGQLEVREWREEDEDPEDPDDVFDVDDWNEPSAQARLLPHHFSVIRTLGQGASGTCHLAVNTVTGEDVAMKCIEWAGEALVNKQFMREVAALRKCKNSPNIVRLLGEMIEGEVHTLVFEYMDGGSLERYGALPPRVLSVVSYSLLDALIFMKQLNILHRDIKRANVLVSLEGEVKLCDMGLSRILPPNSSAANTYLGDNYYMPPERMLGLKYRVPSEVWGWAVVLCECALGRHPYLEEDESLPRHFAKIQERMKKSQAFTHLIPQEYGQDFMQLISANTHFDPSTRWNIITLHRSPYITRSRTVNKVEAGEWFSEYRINNYN